MSSESTLILFGFLTLITPFLGLPSAWYEYIFPVFGLVVLGIGILLRKRTYQRGGTAARASGASASATETSTDTSSADTSAETTSPETPPSNPPSDPSSIA